MDLRFVLRLFGLDVGLVLYGALGHQLGSCCALGHQVWTFLVVCGAVTCLVPTTFQTIVTFYQVSCISSSNQFGLRTYEHTIRLAVPSCHDTIAPYAPIARTGLQGDRKSAICHMHQTDWSIQMMLACMYS